MPKRTLPIAVVARETGISPDLLRKWEARYGFPKPIRSASGIRSYPLKQLDILREIKRLIASGLRPGEAIRRSSSGGTCQSAPMATPMPGHGVIEASLEAICRHDIQALHRLLDRSLFSLGLQDFISRIAAPLTVAVGDAWLSGRLRVHEEHLFTQTLSSLLSELHRRLHVTEGSPRILLTTAPGELHTLGLDMVRVLLAEAGAHCLWLGAQTPLSEIAAAATAYEIDVVALSYSTAYPARLLNAGLAEIRASLAPDLPTWIGGAGALAAMNPPPGIRVFITAAEAINAVHEFRNSTRPG